MANGNCAKRRGNSGQAHEEFMPAVRCARCGYDLRGVPRSGNCPECGTAAEVTVLAGTSLIIRIRAIPLGRMLALIACALVVLLVLAGYVYIREAWVCSECARTEFRGSHCWRVPIIGSRYLRLVDGCTSELKCSLSEYLDPEHRCQHKWQPNGWSGWGIIYGWRGIGPDRTYPGWIECEKDFGSFLTQNPELLERIRESIRTRVHVSSWLPEQYKEWKGREQGGQGQGPEYPGD